jgi:hypothetical protein
MWRRVSEPRANELDAGRAPVTAVSERTFIQQAGRGVLLGAAGVLALLGDVLSPTGLTGVGLTGATTAVSRSEAFNRRSRVGREADS